MKDAKGHGSDTRNGSRGSIPIKTAGLRGVGLGPGARFSPRYTNTRDTVDSLRAQMRTAGPGHQVALWQGIKNLLGG